MKVTTQDIAKHANTSRATVDRVLHKRGNVKRSVEERILAAIEELGYETNEYARALVKSKTKYKIGIILASYQHQFFSRVKAGIELKIIDSKQQFEYFIYESEKHTVNNQLANINKVITDNVDLLVIAAIPDQLITNALAAIKIPVILITHDHQIPNKLCYVGADYFSNGVIAADIVNGLLTEDKKLLIISGPENVMSYQQRLKGFLSNLNTEINYQTFYSNNDDPSTYEIFSKVADQKYDLIYFASYGINGLYNALSDFKMSIKIVGVDETRSLVTGLRSDKVLFTITQQPEKQGYRALALAQNYLLLNQKPLAINYIGNKIKVKHSNFNEKIGEKENE
jgi:LacI family transcriptional regulator